MNKRFYIWSSLIIFCFSVAFTSCSPKTGCPALGTTATKKERKKGGNSNLFDKKTRRKIG